MQGAGYETRQEIYQKNAEPCRTLDVVRQKAVVERVLPDSEAAREGTLVELTFEATVGARGVGILFFRTLS